MVVTTMDEASMAGDARAAQRGSAAYDKTDEAAMLAVVERTDESIAAASGHASIESALAPFVTESAAAGHAKVLAACLAKGAPPDGDADIEALHQASRDQREFKGMGGAKPVGSMTLVVPRVPLTLAIGANSLECTRLLLDAGCDPNAGNMGYASPFFCALTSVDDRDKTIAIVRLLVEAGCNVNAKCLDGATVLFGLAKASLHEVVEAVVARGADTEYGPGPPDGSYMTPPLAFACAWNGMPPHLVARYGGTALVDKIATVREMIRLGSKLVPRGAPSRNHPATPEAMLRRWATAAGPPHKADDLCTAVADLKIKDMRAIIRARASRTATASRRAI